MSFRRKKRHVLKLLKLEPEGDHYYAEVEASEFDRFADREEALVLKIGDEEFILASSPLQPILMKKVYLKPKKEKSEGTEPISVYRF